VTVKSKIDGRPVFFDGLQWLYDDTQHLVEDFSKEGTLCQGCGQIFFMDLIVPDELWEQIKPPQKPKGAGLLCPSCICKRVEKTKGFSVYCLIEAR